MKKPRRALACAPPVRFKLEQLLDSLAFPEQPGLKTTKESRRVCQRAPARAQGIQYLRTSPGIGWSVASQLLARIGDGRELKTGRQLAGLLGVVPTEPSTGDRTARGAITPTGAGRLRSNLIHAAWSAIRQDDELREFLRSLCRTPPRPLASRGAIVAVARKLSRRIAVVLRQQRPYEVRAKARTVSLDSPRAPAYFPVPPVMARLMGTFTSGSS